MKFSIKAIKMMDLIVTLSIHHIEHNDTQHKPSVSYCWVLHFLTVMSICLLLLWWMSLCWVSWCWLLLCWLLWRRLQTVWKIICRFHFNLFCYNCMLQLWIVDNIGHSFAYDCPTKFVKCTRCPLERIWWQYFKTIFLQHWHWKILIQHLLLMTH